jgi:predicted esterase
MHEHHLEVARTARYFTLGPESGAAEVWFVLHGYGQLASRFLRSFAPLDDGTRLIVAPEGLSRFYVSHAEKKVGASWMTREDRLTEIADYVRYLDAVYDAVRRGTGVPLHVLGFSQGCATAARWLTQGTTRANRLVLWGGEVPPDLELDDEVIRARLAAVEITLVVGNADEYITPKIVTRDSERLTAQQLRHHLVRYEGGHDIDESVLRDISARSQPPSPPAHP